MCARLAAWSVADGLGAARMGRRRHRGAVRDPADAGGRPPLRRATLSGSAVPGEVPRYCAMPYQESDAAEARRNGHIAHKDQRHEQTHSC
eukprot:1692116-Pleurochrysis_carterae.AAC.1